MNRLAGFACLLMLPASLLAGPAHQAKQPAREAVADGKPSTQSGAGDRIFAANCSRCHQAPMSLSRRITGTVVMHMRTRARLSREDERLLLKFLAP